MNKAALWAIVIDHSFSFVGCLTGVIVAYLLNQFPSGHPENILTIFLMIFLLDVSTFGTVIDVDIRKYWNRTYKDAITTVLPMLAMIFGLSLDMSYKSALLWVLAVTVLTAALARYFLLNRIITWFFFRETFKDSRK